MINFRKFATLFAVSSLMVGAIAAPMGAQAQTVTHWVGRQLNKGKHVQQHKQTQKNNWRNLGYAGGGVAVLGLLTHSPLLVGVGVAGGLYSAYRYEQDRKGQSAAARRRYAFFSHKTRVINGHHYRRVILTKKGHKYYAYKRVS
ncbi:MAG: hypothetical protein ACYC96_06560 [Fimbriimonadaceae bacterium]